MKRVAERAVTVPAVVVPGRLARFSGARASERGWLQEGFEAPRPDLEDFLGEAPPSVLSGAYRLVLLLFATLVGLASVLKVDVIVAAGGRLAADAPTVVLQPMQLSVVRELRVRPGDVVRKGDVLASLDPTFTQADRAVLLSQRAAVRAQLGRIEAELGGAGFSGAGISGEGEEAVLQGTLFRQRTAQYAARMTDFGQRLAGLGVEAAGAEQQRGSAVQQLAVSREVEGMRATLFRSQSGSKLAYFEAQGVRMRAEREVQQAVAALNAVQEQRRGVEAERQAFADGWRRELLEGLVKTRAEALAVDESLTKANRLAELVVLAAPEDGVVLEVAKRSVGSVLNAAEPLITMVPSGAGLVAEVMIGSADVGYATPGDVVAVKVDAFPYQRHGVLEGRLRSIGADSSGGAGGGAYHRGTVALEGAVLGGMPAGARLIPGMTVSAEIKVGTRRVISYLLEPVTRGLSESIREP